MEEKLTQLSRCVYPYNFKLEKSLEDDAKLNEYEKFQINHFRNIILYMLGVFELLMMLKTINKNSNTLDNELDSRKINLKDYSNKKNNLTNNFELCFYMIKLLQDKIMKIVPFLQGIDNPQLKKLRILLKSYTVHSSQISFVEKIKKDAADSPYEELWNYIENCNKSQIGHTVGYDITRYLHQIHAKIQDSTIDIFELVKKMVNDIKE